MSYYRGLDLYWARTWLRGREQFLVPITVEIYHLAEDQNEGLLPTPITEKLTGHISQGGSHGARIVFRAASGSSSPAMLPWGRGPVTLRMSPELFPLAAGRQAGKGAALFRTPRLAPSEASSSLVQGNLVVR